ncbi:uncharacterized protein PAF06_016032 [Gastrophryne carolinensis]
MAVTRIRSGAGPWIRLIIQALRKDLTSEGTLTIKHTSAAEEALQREPSSLKVIEQCSLRNWGFVLRFFRYMIRLIPKKLQEDPELFMKNVHFDSVPVRVYQPRAPCASARKAVVYFHGGGFVFGGIDASNSLCQYIAKNSGAVVVSVGYRLAPEHIYPTPFQDCLNATIHFLKNSTEYGVDPSRVITCGDSAGGNLAAAVTQALAITKDIPKPLAQVLIYPVLQMIDSHLPAYQQNARVPLLFAERTIFYTLNYIRGGDMSGSKEEQNGSHVPPELRQKLSKWLNADYIPEEFKTRGYKPHVMAAFQHNLYEIFKPAFESSCSPLLAESSVICQLPKCFLLTCEFDVLRDDGILYKKRLEDNGVSVTWYHVKDGFHGIVSFLDFESGKQAIENVGKTMKKLGIWTEVGFYRFMMKMMSKTLEEDSEILKKNLRFDSVPVRIYQPRAPSAGERKAVVYFHGGGFIMGSVDSADYFCYYIAKNCGVIVVSVGYRLAPEYIYPIPFQDCLNATIHFLKTATEYGVDPSRVITCGESSGGNLAAAVTQALVIRKDIPKPLAQVLIYPVLQMIVDHLPAHQQNATVPLLFKKHTIFFTLNYIRGGDMSASKKIKNGNQIPPEHRKKLSLWINDDNISENFKTRGYKPIVIDAFNSELYEILKPAFEPSCSPLLAENSMISNLPSSYILTCEFDVLRDDGILYKKRLEDNGVPVTWYHVKDGFHGIISLSYMSKVDSGTKALDNLVNFIKDA